MKSAPHAISNPASEHFKRAGLGCLGLRAGYDRVYSIAGEMIGETRTQPTTRARKPPPVCGHRRVDIRLRVLYENELY